MLMQMPSWALTFSPQHRSWVRGHDVPRRVFKTEPVQEAFYHEGNLPGSMCSPSGQAPADSCWECWALPPSPPGPHAWCLDPTTTLPTALPAVCAPGQRASRAFWRVPPPSPTPTTGPALSLGVASDDSPCSSLPVSSVTCDPPPPHQPQWILASGSYLIAACTFHCR